MKILYLHGLGSQPGGIKPTYLIGQGFDVINPALDNADFDEAVRAGQQAFDDARPDLVIGSSRGGAVALNIRTANTPLILIAPAWRKWGTVRHAPPATWVLHSTADSVIRHDDSRALLALSGLPDSHLITVGIDHNMTDPAALDALVAAIRRHERES